MGYMNMYENALETLNDRAQDAQEQLDNCECEGSMAKPWLFCDDCQEARDILDNPESVAEYLTDRIILENE